MRSDQVYGTQFICWCYAATEVLVREVPLLPPQLMPPLPAGPDAGPSAPAPAPAARLKIS